MSVPGYTVGSSLEDADISSGVMRLRPDIAGDDLADFVEHAPVGLHWLDADGTLLWANRADYEPLGYARAEYVGRPLRDFHADICCICLDAQFLRIRVGI